ncbi:MAG: hypothetical protein AAGI52_07190 [Bacteroidota bacterium]
MRRSRRLICFVLAALVVSLTASAQDGADLPSPWALFQEQEGDGPLSAYARGLAEEDRYRASAQRGGYYQMLAQQSARLGAHAAALAQWDAAMGRRADSVGVLPEGAVAADAAEYVAERAEAEQVVMVNEAHHDAATRLLTLRLLPLLYERGYRYFAAETFTPFVTEASARGYPVASDGHYVDEPVFGALVREAVRLGYTLVPYEIEEEDQVESDSLNRQQRRDLTQAQHLTARIFADDPEAKVLVHAGFGHIVEEITGFYPMVVYFREITGIDPLTVDQTALAARSEPGYDHPVRRAAEALGAMEDRPAILLRADGQPVAVPGRAVDLRVLAPRTERPSLLAFGPPHATAEVPAACDSGLCLAEVYVPEEPPGVPLDRFVPAASGPVRVVFREGARVRVLSGETGAVLSDDPLSPDE